MKLVYRRPEDDNDECIGDSNASWGEDPDNGRSHGGYVFLMCGAAIGAQSKQ
jgi:hypothetical protein